MPTKLRLPHYLCVLAVVVWAVFICVEYFSFHGRMLSDFLSFPYAGLVGAYTVLAVIACFVAHRQLNRKDKPPPRISYRGIGLYGLVLLAALLAIAAFALAGRLPAASLPQRLFYFAAYASYHVGGLFIIVSSAFGIGSVLVGRFRHTLQREFIPVAIALGLSSLGTLFSLLGLLNMLVPIICWVVVVAGLGVGYRALPKYLVDTLWTKRTLTIDRAWVPAVLVALVGVLGVTLVGAFKTFPIGFDGAALYLNTAMLTADSGGLPYGGQAFAWSVVMGVGNVLFGSLTMAILLSHLMGILCIIMVYQIARLYLSSSFALLLSLLVVSAPFFVFHSLVDEKVDLAFTFICLSAFFLALKTLNLPGQVDSEPTGSLNVGAGQAIEPTAIVGTTRAWLLIGLLVGFAFTIKYTAVIFALALGCYWLYQRTGKFAFTGGILTSVGLLFASGIYRLGYIDMPRPESLAFGGALLLLGVATIAFAFRSRIPTGLDLAKGLGLFTLTFLLAFTPWGVKNVAENGSVSVNHLIQGASVAPPLNYIHQLSHLERWGTSDFYFTDYALPQHPLKASFTNFDQTPSAPSSEAVAETESEPSGLKVNEGAREDVQRYLGYEAPFWRYLSLPYDMTVNSNLGSRLIDIGFLGLLLLPLIFFLSPAEGKVRWGKLAWVAVIVLFLAGMMYSLYARNGEMVDRNIFIAMERRFVTYQVPHWLRGLDRLVIAPLLGLAKASSGLFTAVGKLPLSVIFSVVLATGLLLAMAAKDRLATLPRPLKQFGALLASYAILFWIMGNGVIWYAMPLFVLAPVFLLWFFDRPERFLGPALARFSTVFGAVVIGFTLCFQVALYFTSPFEAEGDPAGLFRYPFVEMATTPGMTERKVQTAFNPASNEILDALNRDMNDRVYRVATQLGHFIKQNDRRVFSDPVLTKYDDIASRLRPGEEERFFDMLKAQGYKYILFDLRLGAVDRTPEKTLQKKFLSLARAIFTTDKLKLVSTDNIVADPQAPPMQLPNGKRANARRGIAGKTLYKGTVLLMEIK